MRHKDMPILNADNYYVRGGLNEGEAIVEEIEVEAVSNDYLEQVVAPYVHNIRVLAEGTHLKPKRQRRRAQ